MIHFKKKIQKIYNQVSWKLFSLLYGKISGKIKSFDDQNIEIRNIILDEKKEYKIYIIKNSRFYTNRIHDSAFIINNKIIDGPSYQLRNNKNVDCSNNIVFEQGTPRFQKKLSGRVVSLLSGGGANKNYWHWLFDVLPKLFMVSKIYTLEEIDYFLFPDTSEKFQRESLDLIGIPHKKRLSSKYYRHFSADEIIVPDHPNNFKNDPSLDSLNIPNWIFEYLKKIFVKNLIFKEFPKKIYIDRSDSKSGHRHLRKIINEDLVRDFLLKNNFKVITLSKLKFEDQIALFYGAEIIIGLHGAGFANIVFSRNSTKVIELKSKSSGDIIGNLAKKNNLNFDCISVDPQTIHTNVQLGDIEIPIEHLKKIIY